MTKPSIERVAVAYFNIVTDQGTDLGWVGFCEALSESMIPAVLHRGGETGAQERAKTDPPKPLSSHGGHVFVPYSWILRDLPDDSFLPAVKAMDLAARRAHQSTKEKPRSFMEQIKLAAGKMQRRK